MYTFFWNASPFSNFELCTIRLGSLKFHSSEQFFMYGKAKLFKDEPMATKILQSTHPKKSKALGRKVSGFNDLQWTTHRESLMAYVCYHKFSQNAEFLDALLNTGDSILVEASPFDKIWGIGLDEANPDALNPSRWKGLNLLGKVLVELRELFKSGSFDEHAWSDWDLYDSWFS
ncbi:hypothetical protein P9112_008116 [Eukaryota sp. TZLM1-RC]